MRQTWVLHQQNARGTHIRSRAAQGRPNSSTWRAHPVCTNRAVQSPAPDWAGRFGSKMVASQSRRCASREAGMASDGTSLEKGFVRRPSIRASNRINLHHPARVGWREEPRNPAAVSIAPVHHGRTANAPVDVLNAMHLFRDCRSSRVLDRQSRQSCPVAIRRRMSCLHQPGNLRAPVAARVAKPNNATPRGM